MDNFQAGSSSNNRSDNKVMDSYLVRQEQIRDISDILSNIPNLSHVWSLIASELIQEKDWANIESEKTFLVKVNCTLKYWLNWKAKNAKFYDLLQIVGKHSTLAKETLLEKCLEGVKSINSIGHEVTSCQNFSKVPHRNDKFTGRSEILINLESNLNFESIKISTCKIALIGMGGSGKSSIVTEFLYRNRNKFSNIFWLKATENIPKQFYNISRVLQLEYDNDEPNNNKTNVKHLIENWFEKSENFNWVIIFDNVEDQKSISKFIPRLGGFVIITTRNSHWTNFNEIKIQGFKLSESIEFMGKIMDTTSYSNDNLNECEIIFKNFDQLPLAIKLALYFIERCKISPKEYLNYYEKHWTDCLNFEIDGIDKSVYTCIKMSLEKIAIECPEAFEWLSICSYISPEYIGRNHLETFIIKYKKLSQTHLLQVQNYVTKYGLMEIHKNIKPYFEMTTFFSIHRLVQKTIQMANYSNIEEIFTQCTNVFHLKRNYTFAIVLHHVKSHNYIEENLISLLRYIIPYTIELLNSNPSSVPLQVVLRIQKLNNLVNRLIKHNYLFENDLIDYQNYFEKVGLVLDQPRETHQFYFNLGRNSRHEHDICIGYFEKSIEIVEEHFGLNHIDTFKSVQEIVNESLPIKDYEMIFKYFQRATMIFKKYENEAIYEKLFVRFFHDVSPEFRISYNGDINKYLEEEKQEPSKYFKRMCCQNVLQFQEENLDFYDKIREFKEPFMTFLGPDSTRKIEKPKRDYYDASETIALEEPIFISWDEIAAMEKNRKDKRPSKLKSCVLV